MTHDRSNSVDILSQLAAAWQGGGPPDLAGLLPPDVAATVIADAACLDLELRFRAGLPARVDDYLQHFPQLAANEAILLYLVETEILARKRHGPAPRLDEYAARFPGLIAQIERLLTPGGAASDPTTAGEYSLAGKLGEGGMGVVYRAVDPAFGRPVAVKIMKHGMPAARFLAEADLTARLQHPGVPPVHARGELPDGRPYLVMKCVEGQTLATLLAARATSTEPAGRWLAAFEQVCQTVGYAHSRGVIHRDLKPHNVMVGAFGEVQVMDWGLARELPNHPQTDVGSSPVPRDGEAMPDSADPAAGRRTHGAIGTFAYMAPEQARGEGAAVHARADVFGLGAVLCQILTGQPPYTGPSGADTERQAVNADLADALTRLALCGADRDLVELCRRCLSPDPADRPADGTAVAIAIAGHRAESERRARQAEAERAAAEVRQAEQRKRWRVQVALTAAVVAVLVVGAAGTLLGMLQAEVRRGEAVAAQERETRERNRRLQAERDSMIRERQDSLASALQGSGRRAALNDLDGARASGLPMTPRLVLLEVDALEATGQTAAARTRLEEAAIVWPAEYESRRDLRLGDLLIGIDDQRAEALIDHALADAALPEADQEFARGLRAATIAAATPHLRRALELRPNHLPARRAYCIALLSTGQLPEAIRAAEDGVLLYPEHPELLLSLLLSHALAGDVERTTAALERLKPVVPEELSRDLVEVARYLPYVTAEFLAGAYGEPAPTDASSRLRQLIENQGTARTIISLAGVAEGDREPLLRLPVPAREALTELGKLVQGAFRGGRDPFAEIARSDAATARLAAQAAASPEGYLRFAHGMVLFTRSIQHQQQHPSDGDGFRARLAAAGAAFEQASTSHGLIDARLLALEKAIFCYTLAGKPAWAKDPRPAWVAKGNELVSRRLNLPTPIHPMNFELLVKSARNAQDYTNARAVLDRWERHAPSDLGACRLRAEIEFKAEAHAPALRAAEIVLAKNPNDAEMRTLANQCRSRLAARDAATQSP